MSSDFMPITMQTGLATQDTSYLRQNQLSSQSKTAKLAQITPDVPNNDQLKAMVAGALDMQKQNVIVQRGSILNILA